MRIGEYLEYQNNEQGLSGKGAYIIILESSVQSLQI